MDVLLLSRLQFALTIMFHYIFPILTIGLSVVLVFLEWRWLRTDDPIYLTAVKFWARIFGLTFAVGVATGIVMEFQFGTNWSAFSRYAGDIFGSALAAEGIFAFFLESGFLSVLIFGWDRVSRRFHFFSTCMVALGSIFSSIWITVANSWQQTPAGFRISQRTVGDTVISRAELTDFWAMIFNPSSLHRLFHVWLGAFIVGAFFVMSVSAWYLLKGKHTYFAKRSFQDALLLATVLSTLQFVSGHLNAHMVAEQQPAKLAAFEGLFTTPDGGAPLYLFGWPDETEGEVKGGLALPGMLSFLLHGNFREPVPGLDRLEASYGSPPVWISFQAYHGMLTIGTLFVMATLYASWCRLRGTIYRKRWLLWFFVFAVAPSVAANELGWAAAETGRQPWVVYPTVTAGGEVVGGLRTAQALSEAVSRGEVAGSIIMFGLVYALLFSLWFYILNSKIQHGPDYTDAGITEPDEKGVVRAATTLADHRGGLTGDREGRN
ncbi:MAG: cytochrome ubiquinol oxidase subunit I [bacterium]|nr:cytochrome ubiquinol oxidase subunit I [bacterium]